MKDYNSSFQRISELAKRAGQLEPDDLIRAHTAQHICVLVSGVIEKACTHLLTAHAAKSSAPRIARYAGLQLGRLQNANPTKIEQLLNSFDPDWEEELKSFWTGRIRDAIASLLNNRHQIAHGQQVGVSLAQAVEWSKDAKAFCDKLSEITKR